MSSTLSYRDVVENWKHYVVDRGGFESRSNGWSNRAILRQFLMIRATLVRQLILSGIDIGNQSIQNLPCVQLDEAPKASCPCVAPSGCTWLRSVKPLPKYLKLLSVNTIEGKDSISYTEWDKVKYRTTYSRSKSKDKKLLYTIKTDGGESYLYIMGSDFLKAVSVSLILEDPYCAIEFPKCCEEKKSSKDVKALCNPWDTPFLLDSALISQVMTIAWQTLPQLRAAAGPDLFNDSVDNTKGDINLKI